MRTHFSIIFVCCLIYLIGCTEIKQKPQAVSYFNYSQVPAYIKVYLDSLNDGQFLIANPNESWNPACTQEQGVPNKQFISASLAADTFKINYWQGGFGKLKTNMVLVMKDKKLEKHFRHY